MNVPLQIPTASPYSFPSQPVMPSLSSIPLPTWSRLRSDSTTKSSQPSQPPIQPPVEITNEKDGFGLPAIDDPDPFGVLALQREGFEIKEAGTLRRPSSEAFEYRPSPTSPIFNNYGRRSVEGLSRRSSRRDSKLSVISLDRGTQTSDLGISTITEDELPREDPKHSPATKATEDLASIQDEDGDDELEEEPEVIIEEPHAAVQIVAQKINSPIMSRAKLVTIPKRVPPTLPQRSPLRKGRPQVISVDSISDAASVDTDDPGMSSRSSSPIKGAFYGDIVGDAGNPWDQVSPDLDGRNEIFSPTSKGQHIQDERVNDNEEFHSMPSTPIETSTPYDR